MKQLSIERLVREGGGKGKKTRVRGYYARLVRSRCEAPVVLAEERDRRVTMVMGPSGIERLLGKSGFCMLIELGHTPNTSSVRLLPAPSSASSSSAARKAWQPPPGTTSSNPYSSITRK